MLTLKIILAFNVVFLLRPVSPGCFREPARHVTCTNTSFEDYLYDMLKLDVVADLDVVRSPLELHITTSDFPTIKHLINPYPNDTCVKLRLNYCRIERIVRNAFGDFPDTTEIDLGHNAIRDVDFVSYLAPSVTILNLTHNTIEFIDFGLFNALDTLDLSHNKLIYINIVERVGWCFPVRQQLILSNNQMTKFRMESTSLSEQLEIDLSSNTLELMEYHQSNDMLLWQVNVKLINLSRSLKDVNVFNISNLSSRTLILANNQLLALDTKLDLRSCQYVDFSNCSLSRIHSSAFQESSFVTLNFSKNNLRLLSSSLFAHSNIHTLDLSFNQIENGNTFQHAIIVNLNLSANRFTELDENSFKYMDYVQTLDLSFNNLRLSKDSFVNCKSLVMLNLAFSNISLIANGAFGGLSGLELLDLEGNLLNNLSRAMFEPLRAIKALNLARNKLTIIQSNSFDGLTVESIKLSRNNIETIQKRSFHNLTRVKWIEINNNDSPQLTIENEAFSHLREIEDIQMQNAKLSKITLSMFNEVPNLKKLNIKNSDVHFIDFSNHSEYSNLEELHVTVNGPLEEKSFLKLTFLKELIFWNCTISSIERRAFQGLFRLKFLEFVDSKIDLLNEGALDGLFNIETLDATDIFKNKTKLKRFLFRDLFRIKVLDLSYIGLKTIDSYTFEGLKRLIKLFLNNNKLSLIQNVTFSGLKSLIELDLSCNNLTYLTRYDFLGLDSLQSLNLSNNGINDMDLGALQHFPRLEQLFVAKNNLTEFKVGAFSNLIHLKVLDLQRNSISSLLIESFLPLRSLEYLNLEHNNLKTITHVSLVSNLKFLRKIGIAANKWQCEYLGSILVTFRNYSIDYSSQNLDFYNDNIEGVQCIDVCKYLLCLKDSHGIN